MKLLADLIPASDILDSKLPPDTRIAALTANSVQARPDVLFFAIQGHTADGHRFAAAAPLAVVEQPEVHAAHPRSVLVRSTRRVLGVAASRWYDEPSRRLQLVGVTGTNGKTTSTFLLNDVWRRLGLSCGLVGTVEYHVGAKRYPSPLTTPDALTLQSLLAEMVTTGVTHAALEVSSIALDQYRVGGSHFAVALFTNLTQDHLDYHGNMASYLAAKRRLFEEYAPAHAVFNVDDQAGRQLYREHRGGKFSFSLSDASADFSARDVVFGKDATTARWRTPAGDFAFRSPLIGRHNVANCLGVAASCFALGLDTGQVMDALTAAAGAPGRLERVPGVPGRHPHVFVDYAHSDDALKNVLASLDELRAGSGGRIVTVFGCGGDRDRGKRPLMARVASAHSDVTIATSDNPRTEDPNAILDDIETGILKNETEYHREADRTAAIALALRLARPEDLVLVAGKGHETYQILGREKIPFDDRAVVRGFFHGA